MPNQNKRRYRALVVDDVRDIAESFARLLGFLGHEASFLTDSRDAVAEVERLKPHIVFLDLAMPHLGGYEVARRIRAKFPQDRIKLVAVTAHAEAQDRAESRKAGFDAHVMKPVDPALVESIIRTVLPDP